MPELPEVKTVVKALKSNIKNAKITDVFVFLDKLIKNVSPQEFKEYLLNETILDIYNVGKNIIFKLSKDKNLISHLRMTGKYFTDTSLHHKRKHDYVIFELNNQMYLFYNDSRQFGTFHIKDESELFTTKPLDKLGKEVDQIDPDKLYQLIKYKTIPIKSFLLDQSYILGIGNIYANEILYLSGVNPWTKVNKIPYAKLIQILNNTKIILDKATELGGSTIVDFSGLNGAEGQFQNHLQVHMRANLPCNKCKTLIKQETIAQRMTYYCPLCQKENYEQEK